MDFVTVEELSERFGVPISTIRRWCAEGALPAEKHGRQWLVRERDVPATPPRRRASRRGAGDRPAGVFDLRQALEHVRRTDFRELWVPDVVGFADVDADQELLSRTDRRLSETRFDPPIDVPIPKTPFFTRSAVLLSLEDRIAYQAVVASFAGKAESQTPASVFSARLPQKPGRYFFAKRGADAWLDWRRAVRAEVERGDQWLIKTDLTAYFDTIPHDLLINEVVALNVDPRVVGLLRAMLRTWALVPGQGIPQGPNASRLLGNLFLLPVDRAMGEAGVSYYRYLDDVRIVAASKREATEAIRLFERECRLRGLLVSSAKTELLHGEAAISDVEEDFERGQAQYLLSSDQTRKARKLLRRILRDSLSGDGHIKVRDARFSIARLTRLRESSVLPNVLAHLEDLAPVAELAMRYLHPFMTRPQVVRGITEFVEDSGRASSPYMLAWVFALMLDYPTALPQEWVAAARRSTHNRNQPSYLRSIAANVLSRGRSPDDLAWLRTEVAREHDPSLLRAYAVALARIDALDNGLARTIRTRQPELSSLIAYLRGRTNLPSLLLREKTMPVGR